MTNEMLVGLSKIEQDWHRYREFKVPPGFDLEAAYANESFRYGLKIRGIEPPVDLRFKDSGAPRGLTEEQTAAILTVLNWEDKRSRARKLQELGIKTATWNGWMKNSEFRDYVMSLTVNQMQDALPVAHESLIKAMEKGSTEAIKFYMELTGRHVDSSSGQTMQNVKMVITRLIESIQRNVKDPQVLGLIQRDFEMILKGQDPSSLYSEVKSFEPSQL